MTEEIIELSGIVDGLDLSYKKVIMVGIECQGPKLYNCNITGMEIIESKYGHEIDGSCIDFNFIPSQEDVFEEI